MKPTVATALSVAGVLVAAALAIAANTAVFAEPDTAPPSGLVGDQQIAGNPRPPAARPPPPAWRWGPVVPGRPAGTITVDADGGLHVVDARPAAGWHFLGQEGSAGRVDAQFASEDAALTATAVLGPDGIEVSVARLGGDRADPPTNDDDADHRGEPEEWHDGDLDDD